MNQTKLNVLSAQNIQNNSIVDLRSDPPTEEFKQNFENSLLKNSELQAVMLLSED